MEIRDASSEGKEVWNAFVAAHYPAIGAFMHSWEWGEFQKLFGREVTRWYVKDGDETTAAFMVVRYALPGGFWYGYSPRGPVVRKGREPRAVLEIIRDWAHGSQSHLAFLRLEPPVSSVSFPPGMVLSSYYVQPRHNTAIQLLRSEEEMIAALHPSTRSNLSRAKRRGVTVEIKKDLTENEYREFEGMMRETVERNSGKDVYPGPNYFRHLFEALKTVPDSGATYAFFYGYQEGKPAACHLVIFFGTTATYLHGASYTAALSSKVTTTLHWEAAREAKRLGFQYYDIGGIDEMRWPSLTDFKRQFRGEEFHYIGNIDIPIRKPLYYLYNLLRKIRHRGA